MRSQFLHQSDNVYACSVFQIRDGSRGKNPTATATWPDTDENDNKLRYFHKLKYYTLRDPPEKLHDPLPKKYLLEHWTCWYFS